jgi:murein L,D-transpeptidase YafK
VLLGWLLGLLLSGAAAAAAVDPDEVWILVDTEVRRLDVYRGYTPVQRFRNVALGSRGTSRVHMAGDGTTPLGEFRITHINTDSRFHIFLGLDYPRPVHFERARDEGLIDLETYHMYIGAIVGHPRPPQDTPLGGHIGIHGIGGGDPKIHARYDWTQGCIAMTNEEIEQLSRFVTVGTRVFIR